MRRRAPKRFVLALTVGMLAGAFASGARFAALSASTLHERSSLGAASPGPATSATPASTPDAGGPPAPQVLGAGTPLPLPVLASCSNPDLPPRILAGAFPAPAHPLALVSARAPKAKLELAVVATPEDREIGLMCVTALRPHAGMIFVFATTQAWDFWMKDTLIPLDMVWVDLDGTVTGVAADVPESTLATPDDKVARRNGSGRYVIELRAGDAVLDGIARGVRLKLPALPHAAR